MNRVNDLLFQGMESLLVGLVLPVILSFVASLVQVALRGWRGFRNYMANYCLSFFMAVITHWILLNYAISGEYKAILISAAALISNDVLSYLTSRNFVSSILRIIGKKISIIAGNGGGMGE